MITLDTKYRVGIWALVYMMLRKLKIPLILAIIMTAITYLMSFGSGTLIAWQSGAPGILQTLAGILYALLKYGWIFTILLAIFLALIEIPEYRGRIFRVNENAFYMRTGIISYKEIAIPYRQIQTINIIEKPMLSLFGLCSLSIVTSAHDDPKTEGSESEAMLPLIHKPLARDLQAELLKHLNTV